MGTVQSPRENAGSALAPPTTTAHRALPHPAPFSHPQKNFKHTLLFSLVLKSPEDYFCFALFCCVFKGKLFTEGIKHT